MMKECVCPPALTRLLKSYWVRHTNAGLFEVLKEVLKDDEENVLCTTLYRWFVLWFRVDMPETLFETNVERGKTDDA